MMLAIAKANAVPKYHFVKNTDGKGLYIKLSYIDIMLNNMIQITIDNLDDFVGK